MVEFISTVLLTLSPYHNHNRTLLHKMSTTQKILHFSYSNI